MSTITRFDLSQFTRAVEERDVATQLSMYGPHAVVTVLDKITPPSSPRVLSARPEVKAWLEDICGRDMTHSVNHPVQDDTGAAYTVDCQYPDGTKVACSTLIELQDGFIARQTVVQVWDEN